ncbi:MAG: GxxExxY protein [Verrucomicrobia bacterium]|nr:GxxExxY protein [Verrucomicrobiota bacterium]
MKSEQSVDPRTFEIIGAAMEVHRELGCGLNEVFYQDALAVEMQLRGIPFVREPAYHVFYKGIKLPSFLRPDFVCYGEVIVELKALTQTAGREESQVLGYLKGTGFQTGLLLNFGAPSLFQKRFIHSSEWLPEAAAENPSY